MRKGCAVELDDVLVHGLDAARVDWGGTRLYSATMAIPTNYELSASVDYSEYMFI